MVPRRGAGCAAVLLLSDLVTGFGAAAVTFMASMYALERRHRGFVLGFAAGCVLSSTYAFLARAWPLGIVEALWALLAFHRFTDEPGSR